VTEFRCSVFCAVLYLYRSTTCTILLLYNYCCTVHCTVQCTTCCTTTHTVPYVRCCIGCTLPVVL